MGADVQRICGDGARTSDVDGNRSVCPSSAGLAVERRALMRVLDGSLGQREAAVLLSQALGVICAIANPEGGEGVFQSLVFGMRGKLPFEHELGIR